MSDTETDVQELEAAVAMYRFLARSFLEEPTTDVLAELRDGEQGQLLKAMGYDLLDGLDGYAPADQEEMLAVEYCRLFIGPGQHISPHEAINRDEHQHWGERTASVYVAYREAGFDLERDVREMPDHVGVELLFVAKLIESEIECLRQGQQAGAAKNREQRCRFLSNHLAEWLPLLSKMVTEHGEFSFYKTLALLAKEWVECEVAEATNGETGDNPVVHKELRSI